MFKKIANMPIRVLLPFLFVLAYGILYVVNYVQCMDISYQEQIIHSQIEKENELFGNFFGYKEISDVTIEKQQNEDSIRYVLVSYQVINDQSETDHILKVYIQKRNLFGQLKFESIGNFTLNQDEEKNLLFHDTRCLGGVKSCKSGFILYGFNSDNVDQLMVLTNNNELFIDLPEQEYILEVRTISTSEQIETYEFICE